MINNVTFLGIINRNRHFDGGRGSVDNPYRIVKIRHLDNIRNYSDQHFMLENDIIFNSEFEEDGEYYNDGLLWRPISSFTGSINGQGYKIENLKSMNNGTNQGSFCNSLYGQIRNIWFENLRSNEGNTRYSHTGGIVGIGYSSGLIEKLFISGFIQGGTWGGGIIGRGGATINRCGLIARVTVGEAAGGFVGRYSVPIYDSYMRGHTSGANHHGGMYGSAYQVTIDRCYSAGLVQGSGLRRAIASIYDGTGAAAARTDDCYFDTEVTTVGSDGGVDSHPRTTAQMTYPYEDEVNYPVYETWDFDNVWAHDVDGTINDGYPYLRDVTPIP
ncbi:MAG: hypothetical protein ACOC22_03320 [bacterium]